MLLPAVTLLVAVMLQQAPIDVGANSGGSFAFDWNGNHADGTSMAETERVEFHYMPDPPIAIAGVGAGDGHRTVGIPLVATVGENVITMKLALVDIPEGVYNLNVRLIGVGGNPSQYSTPVLSLRVRVKNPDKPTNVRVVGG